MTGRIDKSPFLNGFAEDTLEELGLAKYVRNRRLSLSEAIYFPKETDPRETSPTYPQFLIEFDADEQRLCCSLFTDIHDVYLAFSNGQLSSVESLERDPYNEAEVKRYTLPCTAADGTENFYNPVISGFKHCAELICLGDYNGAYASIGGLANQIRSLHEQFVEETIELPDGYDVDDLSLEPAYAVMATSHKLH